MPLYEYECDVCGHRFEAIVQKFADPTPACPKCGSSVHKLQSAPAIQFKGSGFYITDYAKKDDSTAKKDDSTAAKSEGEKKGAPEKKDAPGEKADTAPKAEKSEQKSDKSATSSKSPKSEKTSSTDASPAKKD